MYDYRARVIRVVDGDSLVVESDQGFGGRQEEELRLKDVHAPERGTPGALEAKKFIEAWVAALGTARTWPLHVFTEPNTTPEPKEKRSFVRYVATVYSWDSAVSLNKIVQEFLDLHPEWGGGT